MASKISAISATTRMVALTAVATFGLAGTSVYAQEQESRYFVNVGPAHIQLADEATISIGGAVVPGGGIETEDQVTGVIEFGRTFGENWSASVTVGIPPTTEVNGAGSLAPAGRLGEITYGPMTVAVQRRFNSGGRVQPFVGAGAVFFHVFDTEDGALQDIEVETSFGPMVQAGAHIRVGDNWGVFIDARYAVVEVDVTASLGPTPVEANVDIDPLVVVIGLSRQF